MHQKQPKAVQENKTILENKTAQEKRKRGRPRRKANTVVSLQKQETKSAEQVAVCVFNQMLPWSNDLLPRRKTIG